MLIQHGNNMKLKGQSNFDLFVGSEVISKSNIEKDYEEVWKKDKKGRLCVELENIAEMKKIDDIFKIMSKNRP